MQSVSGLWLGFSRTHFLFTQRSFPSVDISGGHGSSRPLRDSGAGVLTVMWRGRRQSLEPQYKIWSEKNRVPADTLAVLRSRTKDWLGFCCTKWEDSMSNLQCIGAGRQDALEKDVTKKSCNGREPFSCIRGKRIQEAPSIRDTFSMVHHQEMRSLVLMPTCSFPITKNALNFSSYRHLSDFNSSAILLTE